MTALIAREGPLEGQRFDLGTELYIGREGQGLTLDDAEVSRSHAVVRATGEGVTIEDLDSLNGTFVNGERISAVTSLVHGDVVRIGVTSFELEGLLAQRGVTVATPMPRVEAPDLPFGAYSQGNVTGRSRGRVASRQLLPELVAIFAIVATAIALVLYFALR